MKKLRIHLDTSVISFLFADDAPKERAITERLFRTVIAPKHVAAFISTAVMDELLRTHDVRRRAALLQVPRDYPLRITTPLEVMESRTPDIAHAKMSAFCPELAKPEPKGRDGGPDVHLPSHLVEEVFPLTTPTTRKGRTDQKRSTPVLYSEHPSCI